jgi:hypothetical protein
MKTSLEHVECNTLSREMTNTSRDGLALLPDSPTARRYLHAHETCRNAVSGKAGLVVIVGLLAVASVSIQLSRFRSPIPPSLVTCT